jgi:hypothetical protein
MLFVVPSGKSKIKKKQEKKKKEKQKSFSDYGRSKKLMIFSHPLQRD